MSKEQMSRWILWPFIPMVILIEMVSVGWRPVQGLYDRSSLSDGQIHFKLPDSKLVEYRPAEILPNQVGALTYNKGARYLCQDSSGTVLELLYLEYESGNPRVGMELFSHAPERCVANMGSEVTEIHPQKIARHDGTEFFIQSLSVQSVESGRFFVFKAIWVPPASRGVLTSSKLNRFRRAFARDPHPPGAMLMAAVHGATTLDDALRSFEEHGLGCLDFEGNGFSR